MSQHQQGASLIRKGGNNLLYLPLDKIMQIRRGATGGGAARSAAPGCRRLAEQLDPNSGALA